MRTLFIFIFAFTCSVLAIAPEHLEASDLSLKINRGNESYLTGNYKEAISSYESARNEGFKNGYLSYNLGNAYFRSGQKGRAILNYIEARKLLPREDEIRANLDFAIRETEDRLMPKNESAIASLFFWVNDLSQKEHIYLVLTLHGIFWLAMIAWHYNPTSARNITRKTIFCLFLLSLSGAGTRFYLDLQNQQGVVLAKTIQVVSAPGTEAKTLYELHEGAVIKILSRQGEWSEVVMDSGKIGWALNASIGVLGARNAEN